jgi:hypothetical protein
MPVFRNEVIWPAVHIRKIASSTPGDKNLPPRLPSVLKQRHAPPSLPRRSRAHQPRRARAQNHDIELASDGWHWFT